MYHLLKIGFETIVGAFKPVFGQPKQLYWITLLPVCIALLVIYGIVPFAQKFILVTLEPLLQARPATEQFAKRTPVFVAELLALAPWLWLASVQMMNWPLIREASELPRGPLAVVRHPRIWKSTALMFGFCVAVVLILEAFLHWQFRLADQSGNYTFEASGSVIGLSMAAGLIMLSLYGLVIHGMAIGRPVSFGECRRRLKGNSFRLFISLFLIVWIIHQLMPDVGSGWGGSPARFDGSDVAGTATRLIYEFGVSLIVNVFAFSFVMCAISEVISRNHAMTQEQPSDEAAQMATGSA